jgi:hypothetical protein
VVETSLELLRTRARSRRELIYRIGRLPVHATQTSPLR